MFKCPNCDHELRGSGMQTCPGCNEVSIPYIAKAPKSMPAKKKRLRPVSKKRAKLIKEYNEAQPLNSGERCAKCGVNDNLDRHHPYGRTGEHDGKPTITLWIWLCRECHDWVHANSTEALSQGWLQPKFYNRPEKDHPIIPWK